jgi:hypothetical protein
MDYVAFAAAGAVLGLVTSERGETTSGQAWRAATWAGIAVGGKLVLDLLQGRAGAVRTGFDGDDDFALPPPVVPPTLQPYPPPYQYAFYYACPDGYALDDAGRCVAFGPPPEAPFSIEREILYLYPEMIVQYPELRLHPEQLFVFRPELRTRYAGVRSVTEIRSRYREIHHQAPPARPKTAPPAGKGRAPARPPSAPTPAGAPPTAAHPAAPPTGVTPLAPPTGATPPTGVTPMPAAPPPPSHPAALTAPPPGPAAPSAPPPHVTGYYVWE